MQQSPGLAAGWASLLSLPRLSGAGQNPSRPSVTVGQPHPSSCLVNVHAKTTLTEPDRTRRWQLSEAETRVARAVALLGCFRTSEASQAAGWSNRKSCVNCVTTQPDLGINETDPYQGKDLFILPREGMSTAKAKDEQRRPRTRTDSPGLSTAGPRLSACASCSQ